MFKTLVRLSSRRNFSTSASPLLIDKFESVLHLKLNRPDERNCLNQELIRRLTDELTKFQEDKCLKSIVLTGSGGNFCSGLDANEIENERTLKALSDLLQLFPLSKPSIVGLEGYATCVGLQLALVFDYKIVENDSRLELNSTEHLPLHPYIKQLYSPDQLDVFRQTLDNESSIKQLVNQQIITRNCVAGCCFGVALELGKCIEKFQVESISYDRNKLYGSTNESKLKDDLIELLNDKTIYTRAFRFLNDRIGRHGASNTDTLDEIYLRWKPKLVKLENDDL